MSISDRLDEIEARADAATDGSWESDRHVRGDGHVVIGGGLRRAHLPGDVPGHAENAEFIAHARTDVPALVAALRAVLGVCNESTIEARPHGGGKPYMIVPIREVRAAIEAALGGES